VVIVRIPNLDPFGSAVIAGPLLGQKELRTFRKQLSAAWNPEFGFFVK